MSWHCKKSKKTLPYIRASNTWLPLLQTPLPLPRNHVSQLHRSDITAPSDPSRNPKTCMVCTNDVSPPNSTTLTCSCTWCTPCLLHLFELSVSEPASHMPPKCHSHLIPLSAVSSHLTSAFKLKWSKAAYEHSQRNKEKIYCTKKTCSAWIKPSMMSKKPGDPQATCRKCNTKMCTKCKKEWHKGKCMLSVDEDAKALDDLAAKNGWKKCPRCNIWVEKKDGCNHMTCRCGSEFCFVCGAAYKKGGDGQKGPGCDCEGADGWRIALEERALGDETFRAAAQDGLDWFRNELHYRVGATDVLVGRPRERAGLPEEARRLERARGRGDTWMRMEEHLANLGRHTAFANFDDHHHFSGSRQSGIPHNFGNAQNSATPQNLGDPSPGHYCKPGSSHHHHTGNSHGPSGRHRHTDHHHSTSHSRHTDHFRHTSHSHNTNNDRNSNTHHHYNSPNLHKPGIFGNAFGPFHDGYHNVKCYNDGRTTPRGYDTASKARRTDRDGGRITSGDRKPQRTRDRPRQGEQSRLRRTEARHELERMVDEWQNFDLSSQEERWW